MFAENIIVNLIQNHPIIVSILAGLIGQGSLIFLTVIGSKTGLVGLKTIIIFGIVGFLLADTIIYFLAKFRIFEKIDKKIISFGKHNKIVSIIDDFILDRLLLAFFISKFIYGSRFATSLYASIKKINYFKIIYAQAIAITLWSLIFLTGVSIFSEVAIPLINIFDQKIQIIFISLAFISILYLLGKFVIRKFLK